MRQVILYRDESDGWVVECPSLPGCVSQGDIREEAIANIREASGLHLDVLREDGKPIPEDAFEPCLVAV